MSASNIQVAIKVRPILRREKEQRQSSNWKVAGNSIQLVDGQPEPYYFDHIFDQDVSNQMIFDTMAKQIVDSGLKGFNGTIFAYGQTSSGKTYTMMGDDVNPGVMVLATKEIFKEIEKATDRQFLLRVGYIEIYNEKIYDLLNKSNQDLKIHETPNGDVSVNCSEYIITCEQDLLSYLCLGSKQRKIGETNMNERSSRSHAIFRIIIESRKTDKTEDDSVQISILNLVDLAGSERADQTGATGSRLKEGGHINKSLLFLSCVIKQLAEDKYVSYRDSKLTRILQASLGGNALTAIICTINPTAVEETLSTLSFANRAKVVKNKPQVNEVLTDAAMMKRLEKEINRLQNELEVEKTKNSQIKVGQLQKRLNEEILKIINSNSSHSLKQASEKRRRTWCPSSVTPPLTETNSAKTETWFPPPSSACQQPTKLVLPKTGINFTPHITLRDVYYTHQLPETESVPNIDEEFMPAEDVCFDDALTPKTSPSHRNLQTPKNLLNLRTASLTPRLTEKESLQKVERELKELEAFTNLENKLNVEHDTYNTLKYKLKNAEQIIARYEKEREDFAFVKVEHIEAETNLAKCQTRCQELESIITDCEAKITDFEKSSLASTQRVDRYEKEVTDLKLKITQLEMENREAVSLEFEYQQHKNKSKLRETELLGALEEKQKEIDKLQRTLQTKTVDALNNSKEELQQISRSLNDSDSMCANCKDLQRILSENKKLIEDFENANLDRKELKENLKKITSEAESAKLRADSLETENDSLKKDSEHLKSLHGTMHEVQNQIANLQAEKCKLESVKIEFEVMSKETANKIAEKINISQEIQALTTQRDTLAGECEKLLADVASNRSVSEELNKLRTENDTLRCELQAIKTKLESAQSDYANLMTENECKSNNYERLNVEVMSTRQQLQTLQSEYQDIQQKYEQIQAECNKHEGTIGEIQSEYDSIQSKYQSLQREYEKLENDSVQSIADCDRVQSQNENLETEIHELKTKVEEAQRKLLENDSLHLELESLKSEMNRLQGEYDRNESIKRKSMSPSKDTIDVDLRAENAKLKQDLEDLQKNFNAMQAEYDDISTQLVDTFGDYETLQNDVAQLEVELKGYRGTTATECLRDDCNALKAKAERLEFENNQLAKENCERKKTIASMTDSLRERGCDERGEVGEIKNDSTESPNKSKNGCELFIHMAQTLAEIEIPTGSGATRTFKAIVPEKPATGRKMLIGSISELSQGTFNELRGAIEFVLVTEESATGDIYDSLEIDDHSSANSCDSLEGVVVSKPSNNLKFNELLEKNTQLSKKISHLEETVAKLRSENGTLSGLRAELDKAQSDLEMLNGEKISLLSQINELNAKIYRADFQNKKLRLDCEELQKTIDSEDTKEETVPQSVYVELKRMHDEVCHRLHENDEKIAELLKERSEMAPTLQTKSCKESKDDDKLDGLMTEEMSNDAVTEGKVNGNFAACKCDEYTEEIADLKVAISIMAAQLRESEDHNGEATKTTAEFEQKVSDLPQQKEASDEKNEDEKTAKYELDICTLREQLKQQECKCQEIQIEIIELRTSLEEKIQESTEGALKFEELTDRYANLQADHDKLQSTLNCEQSKSLELQNTIAGLAKMEDECNSLQDAVASLQSTVALLESERNEVHLQKESLERNVDSLQEKLGLLEGKYNSLKDADSDRNEIGGKLETLQEENLVLSEDLGRLKQENNELIEERDLLKNSERSLHEQLQKLVQDHELIVRDKESLEKECHKSNDELAKLKKELESNLKEKDELEKKLEEVATAQQTLTTELEELKEQREKLKECHKTERDTMEGKCSLLALEIQDLTTTKNELQSALEKAKKHSDFLLQQAKDLEEQLNLELSSVRDSNNSMSQQIEVLHEKLEKAESDLRSALDGTNSENDELIIQLTNKNNSLTTQTSELEEKIKSLTTQLEEAKQCLLGEQHLKQALEKVQSEKDEVIAQLTTEASELVENSGQLEQRLSVEMHLKGVLEKGNAERDDLIVRLTNNNNSLTTKSVELEEKVAILGNQLEESKRHLSAEVERLSQLLTQANEMGTTQISKIEDLTNKIETLEGDLKKTQVAAKGRDSLEQRLAQVQAEYDTLAAKHIHLEKTSSSFEAEVKSLRSLVSEKSALAEKATEMQNTLTELQLKCNSLTQTNVELTLKNKELIAQLKNTTAQATECNRLREELAQAQKDLSTLRIEKDRSLTEWKSKERCFLEQTAKLQNQTLALITEKKALQDQMEVSQKISLGKITHLEQQIETLQKEHSANLSNKSISPRREKTSDLLMGENHQLKVKNMSLMDKLDSCQKSQNEERKNRRLSTHDERRRQSFWDSNHDVSTMTDPTNIECNCVELDQKLTELKQRLLIRDSQVNTLSMELKNHPLKSENANLKKLLIEEESKKQQMRQDMKKMKQQFAKKTNEIKECAKCAEQSKKIIVESTTQTIDSYETECYRKLLGKYDDLKMICRVRHTRIKELEDALSKGKENENSNYPANNNQQYRQKYEQLQKEIKTLSEKYEEAKFLCNMRFDKIESLNEELKKVKCAEANS